MAEDVGETIGSVVGTALGAVVTAYTGVPLVGVGSELGGKLGGAVQDAVDGEGQAASDAGSWVPGDASWVFLRSGRVQGLAVGYQGTVYRRKKG